MIFDTSKSVWSIVYIEVSQVINSKIVCISLSCSRRCRLSADNSAAFHRGLHYLQKTWSCVSGLWGGGGVR